MSIFYYESQDKRPAITAHRPIVHGGRYSVNITDPNIVDFSSNISPAGIPPSVMSNLKQRLGELSHYPDLYSSNLVAELKKYTGLPKTNLITGNGAIEIIYNFCSTFLSKKQVLLPIPTFGEYEVAAKLADCKITFFKTMNLSEDLDSFISKIPRNGCIFICNPNNPTGTILSKKQLQSKSYYLQKKNLVLFSLMSVSLNWSQNQINLF